MKNKPARIALVFGIMLWGGGLAGCTSAPSGGGTAATNRAGGTITVAGSTAMLPLVKDAAAAYQEAHREAAISVSGGGSGTGIAQVLAKAIDIGDSDITAPDHPELVDHRVAVAGFAVVTNASAGVKNLTRAQLRDIFAGKVENWKSVGGGDQRIVPVNRPRSSGTRAVFVKVIMGATPIAEGTTEDATGTVVSFVKQTPGAVSYVALSGVTPGLAVVALDGVLPTPETVAAGRYPIWSYEHMFTNGAPPAPVAAFIDFVKNDAGLVRKNKFIAVSAMKVRETDR